MVVETEVLRYWQWLFGTEQTWGGALSQLAIVVVAVSLMALLVGFLVAAVRYGPLAAGDMTYRVVVHGLSELSKIASRRVYALARLAIQESLRRRVLVTLIVFLVILLFASWFLGIDNPQPARLYLIFVMNATSYLSVLIALFLSAFSLPADIKNKTIHTIVTKPVRASEILLGRMVGFTVIGTMLLAVMGIASYVFVLRSLSHSHQVDVHSLIDEVDSDSGQVIGKTGRTTKNNFHRHGFSIDSDAEDDPQTDAASGHWHVLQREDAQTAPRYIVSPPYGMFEARVPVYGKLRFLDRQGKPAPRGISVGKEWKYRSFIDGGTQAVAIWTFGEPGHPVTAADYPKGLPLELIIRVFRSYKGDIERGIFGSIVVKNPRVDSVTGTQRASKMELFTAKDAYIDTKMIPRELTDSAGQSIDLFDDLVHNGQVEIWIQCVDRSQYFGVAQADAYLRADDGTFWRNFFKAFAGIWIQMVLVISIGVMCSTFLSGPVAMLFTMSIMVLGFFRDFIMKVAMQDAEGGGPIESLVRIVTQKNMVTAFEPSAGITIVEAMDSVLLVLMRGLANVIPDFRSLSTVDYVSEGFDIPANLVSQHLTVCFAYVVGMFIVGYFFFRTREVAK